MACSGGVDSVVLTAVLSDLAPALEVELGVCCIDHGLRPEAREEVEFVRRLAENLQLPFYTRRVEVGTRGHSLQADARRARYEALFAVRGQHGFDLIATGHTRDDQAETVLARIFRSASIASLCAIALRRDDGVIRPLLSFSRAQVVDYACDRELDHRDDTSNLDERFERVRMRAILRALRGESELIDERLAELAQAARDHREAIVLWARTVDVSQPTLSRDRLLELPTAVAKEVLASWVKTHAERPMGSQLQQQAHSLVELGKGELWLSDELQLCVSAKAIRLERRG